MKLKTLLAAVIAFVALQAQAALSAPPFGSAIVNGSFTASLGVINIDSVSEIMGNLGYSTSSFEGGGVSFPFAPATFTNITLTDGNHTYSATPSSSTYDFSSVASGKYTFVVSGTSSGTALIYATSNIAAVPEPETYAMLLVGLGVIGAIARSRKALA